MNALSLSQAFQDLGFILFLTLGFIILMLIAGWYLDHISLKRQLQITETDKHDAIRQTWRDNFLQGISTELIGAAITAFLFGAILLVFQQYQIIENEKQQLELQLGSTDNTFAIEAARIAIANGWLRDGTFQGAYLRGTNLKRAYMPGSDLENALLRYSNFEGAALMSINFKGAELYNVNFKEVRMSNAELEDANLSNANLEGATIFGANLKNTSLDGTNFKNTELTNVNLEGAQFSENTTLPDGTQWTQNTDMSRFTDREHPDYWDPCIDMSFFYCSPSNWLSVPE